MRLLTVLLLATLLPLAAQETLFREVSDPATDTHVEVTGLFTKPAPSGFFPIRVKIANNQKTEAKVYLTCSSGSDYSGDARTTSSYSFVVPGNKISTQDIVVPLGPPTYRFGGETNLTVRMSGSLGANEHTINSALDPAQPSVLLSEKLFTPNASRLDSAANTKFSSGYRSSNIFSGKFDPKQLPDDWLAFSGYDWVMMTDSDWSATPPGSRNAILSWVRLGGRLVIYNSSPTTLAAMGLPADASYGQITLHSIPSDLTMDENETMDLVSMGMPPAQMAVRNDYDSSWPLQALFGTQSFQYAVFIIVLIIFGILVGPVNLFVFAKSGQRHRLFITTPIISLAASLVLVALIIFQDGFGGNGMRMVLMEVRPDEGQNAMFIHQEQFARTGVLTGSTFTVDPACAIDPVPISASRWARYTSSNDYRGVFNLQPQDGKLNASGDWFKSRSEHGHVLSAVLPSRGRIEKAGAADTFLSTFDFPITTLFYQNQAGDWFRADNIVTGQKFTVTPVEFSMVSPELTTETNLFTARHRTMLTAAQKRPGHFIALSDSAPAIETNRSIRWKKTHTVITGPIQ